MRAKNYNYLVSKFFNTAKLTIAWVHITKTPVILTPYLNFVVLLCLFEHVALLVIWIRTLALVPFFLDAPYRSVRISRLIGLLHVPIH